MNQHVAMLNTGLLPEFGLNLGHAEVRVGPRVQGTATSMWVPFSIMTRALTLILSGMTTWLQNRQPCVRVGLLGSGKEVRRPRVGIACGAECLVVRMLCCTFLLGAFLITEARDRVRVGVHSPYRRGQDLD